ncbi:MAG: Ig-like domain-containing protein [Gemmatimonadales bacterium]
MFVLLLAAACGGGGHDTPAAPTPVVSRVAITGPLTTISVGQTVTLTAAAIDAQGVTLAGQAVAWGSSIPAVATVSNNGLVTGVAPGTTIISATVASIVGQTPITVSSGNPLASCGAVTPLALAVGDVHALTSAERGVLCVNGGAAGSEYALVAFNTDTSSANAVLSLGASNITAVTGPPTPQLLPSVPFALPGAARRDRAFELRLRRSERQELAPKFAAAREIRARASRAIVPGRGISPITGVPATPAVGSLIRLNANANSACSNPQYHMARVVAVSNSAIVVADTGAPASGFTDADYQSFAVTFDTLIYPLDTLNFGTPSDIDGNGRALLFFTPAVNQLSPPGSLGYVGGFFYGRDLFPVSGNSSLGACAGSNEGEMFYLPVLDVGNKYNSFFNNRSLMVQDLLTTITHEFQHLICASRRVYVNLEANDFEEVWLDEAQSLVAQELLYFRITGFSPKQNVNLSAVRATPALLAATNAYAVEGLLDVLQYLGAPELNSPYAPNDNIPTAGAGWTFLRYALDQSPASPSSYTRALDNGVVTGFANLANVFGGVFATPTRAFEQWAVAQYLDDTGVSTDPKYAMPSWNYRDIIGNGLNSGVFPLKVSAVVPSATNSLTLRGGGAAYLRFRVNPAATGQVAPTGASAPPASVSLFLIRTR